MTALVLTITAIIVGPILAVQAQKLIERITQKRQAKDLIFTTLMSTRDNRLLPEHVRALNMIDIVFSGGSKKDKAVIESWSEYRDHLSNYPKEPSPDSGKELSEAQVVTHKALCDNWQSEATEFLVNLLATMAENLNYHFDRTLLKRGAYTPSGYGQTEFDQFIIRRNLADIFSGLKSFPIHIVKPPPTKETESSQEGAVQENPRN